MDRQVGAPANATLRGPARRAMPGDLPALVNADHNLVRLGRHLTATFAVGIGDCEWLVSVERGRITTVKEGPVLMAPWAFAVRISAAAWSEFRQPVPRPGYHDIFAMIRIGAAVVEGDLQPFMANLRYVKEVLDTVRRGGPA